MPRPPQVDSQQWETERDRLTSELRRLEDALTAARDPGDNEDEEEGSLVNKLREATKKRIRVEEEFERSSDKWRDERRHLNAEIDRLDRALQKTQAEARRTRSSDDDADQKLREDFEEAIRTRNELEATLEEERGRWSAERQSLREKLESLETRLVESIERANNTTRSDEARDAAIRAEVDAQRKAIELEVRGQLEGALDEARTSVAALEEERGQLHLEIHRLKQAPRPAVTSRAPVPEEAPQKPSRFSLKDKLRTRLRSTDTDSGSEEATRLKDEVSRLEKQLGEEASLRERETARAAEAEGRIAELEGELESSRTAGSGDTARAEAWAEERSHLEAAVADAGERARTELDQARNGWEAERRDLEARLRSLTARSSSSTGEELSPALADLESRVDESEARLRAGTDAWNQERGSLEARILELEEALENAGKSQEVATADSDRLEGELAAAREAVAELTGRLESDAAEGTRERNELAARIESLEAELAASRSDQAASASTAEALTARIEAGEAARQSLVEQLRSDSDTWVREREELTGKTTELEFALEEARASLTDVQDQYQQLLSDFEDARRTGNELGEQLKVDHQHWDEERAQMAGQLEDLQTRLNEARHADASADAQAKKLLADLEASERQLEASSAQWSEERKKTDQRIRELDRALQDERTSASRERQRMEAALGEAADSQAEVENKLEATATRIEAERLEHETALEAMRSSESTLRRQLEEETAKRASTEEAMTARVYELEAALADREAGEQQTLNQALAEADQIRQELEERLRTETEAWETERGELHLKIERLAGELAGTGDPEESDDSTRAASAAGRGIASFGKVLSSLGGSGDSDGDRWVADLEARRQALEVRLMESEDAREALASRLSDATEEWQSERVKLQEQLNEVDPGGQTDPAQIEAQQARLTAQLKEAEARYTSLEEASLASAKAWDDQRKQLEHEISQWEQQVVAEAERVAEETRRALAEEYEKQLQELQSQKEGLELQLQSGAGSAAGAAVDPELIAAEMARVDGEIDEINQLIEDPNAALSNVMRKNAERSELQAYRRGLSYLAERAVKEPKE